VTVEADSEASDEEQAATWTQRHEDLDFPANAVAPE
jgi:hypothetical protein